MKKKKIGSKASRKIEEKNEEERKHDKLLRIEDVCMCVCFICWPQIS